MRKLEKDIYDRTERLLGEMRQRDLLLAAREEELKTLKQNVASGLNELQILMTKRARDTKPPRLVSFLADIGKKH